MDLKNSETYTNLMAAFAEESKVRMQYEMFAQQASSDGLHVLEQLFQKTADNEREHAETWYKLLCGGEIAREPENLNVAAAEETSEHEKLYRDFAAKAREEGFEEIARKFEMVGEIERTHAQRFTDASDKFSQDKLFSKPQAQDWICLKCGYVHNAKSAPMTCPVCDHSKGNYDTAKPAGGQ